MSCTSWIENWELDAQRAPNVNEDERRSDDLDRRCRGMHGRLLRFHRCNRYSSWVRISSCRFSGEFMDFFFPLYICERWITDVWSKHLRVFAHRFDYMQNFKRDYCVVMWKFMRRVERLVLTLVILWTICVSSIVDMYVIFFVDCISVEFSVIALWNRVEFARVGCGCWWEFDKRIAGM